MSEGAKRVAVSYDDEGRAAEALKDARRRFPGKVRASVEDPVDRGADGARRVEEAEDVIVGPSYAMTTEQAKHGSLGMVIGAAIMGALTLLIAVPIAAAGTISVTTAALIVLAALMAGGTIGVLLGGRSGGIEEARRDEKGHRRRVVVEIDAPTPGEAAAAREMLRFHSRREQHEREAEREDVRPHGPIEHRS